MTLIAEKEMQEFVKAQLSASKQRKLYAYKKVLSYKLIPKWMPAEIIPFIQEALAEINIH